MRKGCGHLGLYSRPWRERPFDMLEPYRRLRGCSRCRRNPPAPCRRRQLGRVPACQRHGNDDAIYRVGNRLVTAGDARHRPRNGSTLGLFALCLDERIHAAVCEGGLVSYAALASSDRNLQGASIMIPDVFAAFRSARCGRRLALLSPLDAMNAPVPVEEARKAYNRTAAAYSRSHASGNFTIAEHHPETSVSSIWNYWAEPYSKS